MLEIRLLGTGQVRRAGAGDVLQLPPAATNLLAYLLVHRERAQPRDMLASVFWGDLTTDRARRRLNTTVWRLRRALEVDVRRGTYLTVNRAGAIAFNFGGGVWLDVAAFESAMGAALQPVSGPITDEIVRRLSDTVTLYRGELLDGSYETWVLSERERLAELYLAGLTRLLLCHQKRDETEVALRYARQILEHDPLREDVHRLAMRLLADTGRRTQALQQFARCQRLLHEGLGVAPLPETAALASAIRAGGSVSRWPAQSSSVVPFNGYLLDRLLHVHGQVRELETALRQAIKQLRPEENLRDSA
jgi:DNA-binding SARP family transcriptional activator